MKHSLRAIGSVALTAAVAMAAAGMTTVSASESTSESASVSASESASVTSALGDADALAEVAAPRIDDPISEAELQDLQTIAQQSNLSLQDAIERYAWNDNFAMAAAEIREQFFGAFAGAEIVDADYAWIAFADQAPAEASSIVDAFTQNSPGVTVDTRTGVGYTEADLVEAVEKVHFAVYSLPEVSDATTSYDSEAREIRTTALLGSPALKPELDEIRAVAETSLANVARAGVLEDFTTVVVQSSGNVVGGNDSSAYHMGGEDITGCTSGFGTRADSHTSGTRGISTAGHCNNSQTDDGSSLTYRGGHEGTHGDFQWHTGPKTENDNFYSGSSSSTEVNSRDVSGIGFPAVGQSLCKNGITNKKDCQEVRKLDVCSGGECHLIQMGARLAAGGDSGGPVFWGNTAYGLHKGWMYDPAWPFDRDLFSRASRIDNGLGVYIATN